MKSSKVLSSNQNESRNSCSPMKLANNFPSLSLGLRPCTGTLALILVCALVTGIDCNILKENIPLAIVHSDALTTQSFHGNQSHLDYFRLLQRDGDSMLIGARNFVYNVSIHDLSENIDRRIQWVSKKVDSDLCFNKGKSEAECHNYIRVLAKKDDGQFLVCGTNAFKPKCRDYELQADGSFTNIETAGEGKCPFDPRHNSTFAFVDGKLYAGTVMDFQGSKPLIMRDNLMTERNDLTQLNAPNFVHSFEYGDFVFFFFRESAVEYMNCGKKVFSRVARVCKGDKGIPKIKRATPHWSSFLKSKLSCSFPGSSPFYFDEIQSVTDIVLGLYGSAQNELIYAIFTTPENSIYGSAICAFSMRDVLDTFEGQFKYQKNRDTHWMPVPPSMVPHTRPGSCVNDSQTLPQDTVNFVRKHPLMNDMVAPYHGEPILIKALNRFSKIAVDPQVKLVDGRYVDVLFVAMEDGKILKLINSPHSEIDKKVTPIVVEELHVFATSVSVNNLQIVDGNKLIVISDVEVKAVPLHRCSATTSCSACVALQDPYCGWFLSAGVCDSVSERKNEENVLQDFTSGRHPQCPDNGENLIPNPSTQLYTTGDPTIPELPTIHEVPPFENEINHVVVNQDHLISSHIPPNYHPGKSLSPLPTQSGRVGKELPIGGDRGSGRRRQDTLLEEEEEPSVIGPVIGATMGGPLIYSAETLAIAVTTACVAALVVGFISGFLFSRKCRGDDFAHFSHTPYLDSKLNKCESQADPNMYTAKPLNNLVTNCKNTNATKTTNTNYVKPAKSVFL